MASQEGVKAEAVAAGASAESSAMPPPKLPKAVEAVGAGQEKALSMKQELPRTAASEAEFATSMGAHFDMCVRADWVRLPGQCTHLAQGLRLHGARTCVCIRCKQANKKKTETHQQTETNKLITNKSQKAKKQTNKETKKNQLTS